MESQDLMLKLDKKFQRLIFTRLINKFGSSKKSSEVINVPASSIRAYKNHYFKSIPKKLLDKIVTLKLVNIKEIGKNTIEEFNKKDQVTYNLKKGRIKRHKKLETFKAEIPSINEILKYNSLNFEEWFNKYQKLINFGARKINYIKKQKNYIELEYSFSLKGGKRKFMVRFPRIIELDKEFSYFFGLWCGDRAGGKRFGICNKNKEVLNFTEEFLKKNHQKVEKILYLSKLLEEPEICYDKKFVLNHNVKGWVLSVHSNNGVLASFFYYLQDQLKDLLPLMEEKESFFAGLFDAEGNVSHYNKSFRWACKNKKLIMIYSKYLRELGLYNGYDGSCIISQNRIEFAKRILPFLKNSNKINLASILCTGRGNFPIPYKKVLNYLKTNPNSTAKEISKALKINKVYSELRILEEFKYIIHTGYPRKYKITMKKMNSLGDLKL